MIVSDPVHWRELRGGAPYDEQTNTLAAGAAHIVALSADQAWEDANAGMQVVQIPYRLDAAVGQTVLARIDDGREIFGRISLVEHIVDPPQTITRLEIEVAAI